MKVLFLFLISLAFGVRTKAKGGADINLAHSGECYYVTDLTAQDVSDMIAAQIGELKRQPTEVSYIKHPTEWGIEISSDKLSEVSGFSKAITLTAQATVFALFNGHSLGSDSGKLLTFAANEEYAVPGFHPNGSPYGAGFSRSTTWTATSFTQVFKLPPGNYNLALRALTFGQKMSLSGVGITYVVSYD